VAGTSGVPPLDGLDDSRRFPSGFISQMLAKQYEVFQIVRERLVELLRLAIFAEVLVHRAFD
jgi:hypothetical protein